MSENIYQCGEWFYQLSSPHCAGGEPRHHSAQAAWHNNDFGVSHMPAGKYGCLSLGRRYAAMDALLFEKDDTVFKRRC